MHKQRFIDFISYEKRFSKHTITAYNLEIDRFLDFLNQEGVKFEDVDYHLVRHYVGRQKELGRESSSVNRTISSLKTYFKYLERENLFSSNPATALKALRLPKKLPAVVQAEKLVDLLDFIKPENERFVEYRDYLVMELLFGTGIRLSELIGIKDKDVDIYNKKILILGKRNKERFVPMNITLVASINRYLDLRKSQFPENNFGALIVTNRGDVAYEMMIYRVVKKCLSLITSQKKRSPHVLRHSFATALLDKGADLNAIKEILGHAGLASTQVYTHNSAERLKSIYKLAHPKA